MSFNAHYTHFAEIYPEYAVDIKASCDNQYRLEKCMQNYSVTPAITLEATLTAAAVMEEVLNPKAIPDWHKLDNLDISPVVMAFGISSINTAAVYSLFTPDLYTGSGSYLQLTPATCICRAMKIMYVQNAYADNFRDVLIKFGQCVGAMNEALGITIGRRSPTLRKS